VWSISWKATAFPAWTTQLPLVCATRIEGARAASGTSGKGTGTIGRRETGTTEVSASPGATARAASARSVSQCTPIIGKILLDTKRVTLERLLHPHVEPSHQLAGIVVVAAGMDKSIRHGLAGRLVPVENVMLVPGVESGIFVTVI
jgi:hypothetical protein